MPPSRISSELLLVGNIVPTSTRNILRSGPQSETILDKCNAEPSPTSVLGSMRLCNKKVNRKPTNWKDIETSIFHRKEKRVPVGSLL